MSWEAIRAFATEVQRREKEVVDSNDLNSNRWYYAKAITAAREAQALLLEYEAQSKRLNRAVELLQELIAGALELDLSYESMPVQRAVEFLRELEVE